MTAADHTARLYRIPVDGEPIAAGNALPTLADLQAFVGGYVEHVGLVIRGEQVHLFVNENGRSEGLAPNVFASGIYAASFNQQEIRAAVAQDASVLDGLTIRGNAWMWRGPLPADA